MANRHMSFELLDIDKFVKVNELQEVTNPIFFTRDNAPTPDGLLSNEIFGITKTDRASTFAYISLGDTFIHPLYYKIWYRTDRKIKDVVHGVSTYSVNKSGEIVEDPNGSCGISFLKKNIDKIKWKRNDSLKRNRNISFLEKNKSMAFITKIPVIPAYYRDVNSGAAGRTGVGEINKLYNQIMISARSIKESEDYGLSFSESNKGRMQELLLSLYNWFGSGTTIGGQETSAVLPSKQGVIKRAALSKTTDYSSRVVISAPQLKAEELDDLEVTIDRAAVPLSSICTNFYPFMVFGIRTFFENEFGGRTFYEAVQEKSGKIVQYKLGNWQTAFSDDNIKKQIERFLKGFSNRLIPVELPVLDDKGKSMTINMRFTGYNIKNTDDFNKETISKDKIVNRDLTWCDIFYMVATEVTINKKILITRFPMDSYYNQYPTNITVSSTKETEPMFFPDSKFQTKLYKRYPKIRSKDIGSNTSNMFIDTLNMSNVNLPSIGGDYDGDQVTIKGVYSDEANAELDRYANSKSYYVDLGASIVRSTTKEGLQSLYNLTLVLPESNLTDKVE
jgi:DNA-directed RNA polymerase beta' subunit